jgi:hypothetical protein
VTAGAPRQHGATGGQSHEGCCKRSGIGTNGSTAWHGMANCVTATAHAALQRAAAAHQACEPSSGAALRGHRAPARRLRSAI